MLVGNNNSSWYAEFLAESTIALNQEEDRNQLDLVITPLKQFLQEKRRHLTAYDIAKSSGASSQLAFFCEFCSFAGQVMQNLGTLSDYTYTLILSTLKPCDRENQAVLAEAQQVAQGQILSMQITYLSHKLEQLRADAFVRYPYLSRFLNSQKFQKVFAHEQLIERNLASKKNPLSQYLDILAGGFTYYTVALPALAGIGSSLKEQEDVIDHTKIQWSLIESTLTNISLLLRISHDIPLALFLKELATGDKLSWFLASLRERADLAEGDTLVKQQIQEIKLRITERTRLDIEAIILPEQLKQVLLYLIDWVTTLRLPSALSETDTTSEQPQSIEKESKGKTAAKFLPSSNSPFTLPLKR